MYEDFKMMVKSQYQTNYSDYGHFLYFNKIFLLKYSTFLSG